MMNGETIFSSYYCTSYPLSSVCFSSYDGDYSAFRTSSTHAPEQLQSGFAPSPVGIVPTGIIRGGFGRTLSGVLHDSKPTFDEMPQKETKDFEEWL
jgi:hypothetical protein